MEIYFKKFNCIEINWKFLFRHCNRVISVIVNFAIRKAVNSSPFSGFQYFLICCRFIDNELSIKRKLYSTRRLAVLRFCIFENRTYFPLNKNQIILSIVNLILLVKRKSLFRFIVRCFLVLLEILFEKNI